MKKIKILTILIVGVLVLTACEKANQTPEPLTPTKSPGASATITTITETSEVNHPTKGPTPTSKAISTEPAISETTTSQISSPLELVNELSVDQPGKLKWCSDQTCVILSAYDSFSIYSYPQLELLHSQSFDEGEFLLDVSPDGETYAMTHNNEDIILKRWASENELVISTGTFFMGGEFSQDGNLFMISSQEQWAGLIFDVETGTLLSTITGFETAAPVYNIRFGQTNEFAIWFARATIQVSEIASNQLFPAIFHQDFVLDFDMNSDGTILATSASEAVGDEFLPTVFLYDFKTGDLVDKFNTNKAIYSLKFSPDNSQIAYSLGFSVAQYDLNTKQFSDLITNSAVAISQILYSPDGSLFVTSEEGSNFKFYNLK